MSASIEPGTVKRALSAHAAVGLLAGAILYILCLTGTIAVFYVEMQRLEQPNAPEMAEIAPEAVQRGVEAVLAREAQEGLAPTTHLYVHIPVEELPRATVTTDTQAFHLDREGRIAMPEMIEWNDFLVHLHYTLNLPSLVGITIVGIFGVMMLALSLSGVIAHPRIFRDAFRLRARNNAGVGLTDWHNRLSVWTLPFGIAIALTGALIGLATVTAYGLAESAYGGDVEAVYAPVFGEEGPPDPAPAAAPDVAAALQYMAREYPDVRLTYAVVHDPLTAGQHVQMIGDHQRRLIFGEYYAFDSEGAFQGTTGMADGALGQQAAASTYKLHFGNFGGVWVKIAYVALGAALTAICATGSYIWLGKRRRRGIEEPRLRAAWTGVIVGTPVALVATAAARAIIGNEAPFAAIFWIGLAAWIGGSIALAGRRREGAPETAA
ncbi:PepSY-associated TM helix domain-containing protein [Pelagerythrobacter marensis]|uniref:PepSY-associated TM helix n=1 Tax=Pelagerythrobacter marensis TaxID=543877 RepID=A0A0G3X6A3_9SPHN|nr:PepSY-associated TM helix domain-containing protein [Pelagerythrobacter marensis]AKM06141.1 PepSY-associated TM helix [Pelagerythrobacter marensis]